MSVPPGERVKQSETSIPTAVLIFTSSHVVDGVIGELLDTGGLNLAIFSDKILSHQIRATYHDIKAVLVVLLDLGPLRVGILPIKFNVLVGGVELLRNVHLGALVRSNHDFRCAVELEELSEDKAGGACAEEEDFDANGGVELVKAVDGACGGLQECRLFIGQVVDLVALLLVTVNLLGHDKKRVRVLAY